MEKKIKIISGVISSLVSITIIIVDSYRMNWDLVELFGLTLMFIVVYFLSKVILKNIFRTNKGVKVVDWIIEKEGNKLVKKQEEIDNIEYLKAKKTFKYYSDEKLIELYDIKLKDNIENIQRLALEEIMIDRGILSHSIMHEKIFNSKTNTH